MSAMTARTRKRIGIVGVLVFGVRCLSARSVAAQDFACTEVLGFSQSWEWFTGRSLSESRGNVTVAEEDFLEALDRGAVAADTRVLVTETATGPLALLTDQMAYHHLAQGQEAGALLSAPVVWLLQGARSSRCSPSTPWCSEGSWPCSWGRAGSGAYDRCSGLSR